MISTVGLQYAKAIYDLANEKKLEDLYFENLKLINNLVNNDENVLKIFSHPSINKELHKYLVDYCQKNNLLQGGGSDYHGFRGELNSEKVPYEMYLAIKERLEDLKNNRLITNIK